MTFINSSGTEGVQLDKERHQLECGKNIKFTSVANVNDEELYKKIIEEIHKLERKNHIETKELHQIHDQIRHLRENSEWRRECEFYYQHLLKNIQKGKMIKPQSVEELNNVSLLSILKNSPNPDTIEEHLLKMKIVPFANIGTEGRKQIIKKLMQLKSQFNNDDDIYHFVNNQIQSINDAIENVRNATEVKLLLKTLKTLELKWFTTQTSQIQQLLAVKLLERNLPSNLTLTSLDKTLRKLLNEIDSLSTVPIALLNKELK